MGDTKRQATSGEVVSLRQENGQLKELVADLSLKNVVLKKLGWHGRGSRRVMRFTQSEKMETIRLVRDSQPCVKRTLEELDVSRSSFYRWHRRYQADGYDGLANRPPNARRFWNRIPESEKQRVIDAALAKPELTPRELA